MTVRFGALMLSFWALLVPASALAQSALTKPIVPDSCLGDGGCQSICDIAQLAQNVLNTGIYIAVFLSAIMFAYAGWLYLSSASESSNISKARNIFTTVIVGLVIILASWLIVDTVMKALTNQGKLGPWNKICQEFLSHFEHFYA